MDKSSREKELEAEIQKISNRYAQELNQNFQTNLRLVVNVLLSNPQTLVRTREEREQFILIARHLAELMTSSNNRKNYNYY